MKSEKGIALASIIIYVIALTITVITIGRITVFFYRNINSADARDTVEYVKFNSYFTKDINTEENSVSECYTDENSSYIVFGSTENQYTWQNGKIYFGKVKICNDIDDCDFLYNDSTGEITVNMTINGHVFTTVYTINKS